MILVTQPGMINDRPVTDNPAITNNTINKNVLSSRQIPNPE